MMSEKQQAMKKIHAIDFAIHELVLFADTHPESKKAMELMRKYKSAKKAAVKDYENKFGRYICKVSDVPLDTETFTWIDSPWPWETEE